MLKKMKEKLFSTTMMSMLITVMLYGAYAVIEHHLTWFTEERGVSLFKLIDGLNRYTQCMNVFATMWIIMAVVTAVLAIVTLIALCFNKEEG